jgi:hypothetical protein
MDKKNLTLLLVAALVLSACCNQCLTMTVTERQLIDARHDHLRCEVYLDRLRDLYNVPDEEKDGLMDEDVDPQGIEETVGLGAFDGPLTGKHDGPLTGKHDGPLTRGHDDPLTGKHDDIDELREATMVSATKCWDATERLVEKYNECLDTYVDCRDADVLTTCYEPDYLACLDSKNTL